MGTGFRTAFYKSGWLTMIPLLIGELYAQTTLVLSSATTTTEGASLEFSLDSSSGAPPAAIQWTFHPSSAIRSVDIVDGPVLAPAGKTIVCAGDLSAFTCMAVGLNAELIPDGVVARVNVVLEPIRGTATINIVNALAVSAAGDPIAIATTDGTVTRRPPSDGCNGHVPCRI